MEASEATGTTLPDFLKTAYDADLLRQQVDEQMLSSRQSVAALHPIGGHMTKDRRVMTMWQVSISDPVFHSQIHLPVAHHYCDISHVHNRRAYEEQPKVHTHSLLPTVRKSVFRTGARTFVSAFPCDPELKQVAQLLRPDRLLKYINECLPAGMVPVRALSAHVLGYRPERRCVLGLDLVTDDGDVRRVVAKLSRVNDAARAWQLITKVRPLEPEMPFMAWPQSYCREMGIIVTQREPGDTLHALLMDGTAAPKDLRKTGELLRHLHETSRDHAPDLPTFSYANEMEILDRWRRLLKHGGSELSGSVARFLRVFEEEAAKLHQPLSIVHRDFYPKQVLVHPYTRTLRVIDFDTMALGPAAVDVGNFVAHLRLAELATGRSFADLRKAFLTGYGKGDMHAIALYELSSTARLAALASVGPHPEHVKPLVRVCSKIAKRVRS